jgi:hypothetical protein
MDIYAALEEVEQWCARATAAGDPDKREVECHADVCITIGESAPPWCVRWERRSSAGASAPVAQLRYDIERKEWALHHGELSPYSGWCSHEDAVHATDIGPLLDQIANDRDGRYQGLPPGFTWG